MCSLQLDARTFCCCWWSVSPVPHTRDHPSSPPLAQAAATRATSVESAARLSAVPQPLTLDVVVAPSALFVDAVAAAAPPGVAVALQDVHVAPGLGAYTGSHTVAQLAGGAVRWVLVGHSERRSLFAEADAASGAKAAAAAAAGLGVIRSEERL